MIDTTGARIVQKFVDTKTNLDSVDHHLTDDELECDPMIERVVGLDRYVVLCSHEQLKKMGFKAKLLGLGPLAI